MYISEDLWREELKELNCIKTFTSEQDLKRQVEKVMPDESVKFYEDLENCFLVNLENRNKIVEIVYEENKVLKVQNSVHLALSNYLTKKPEDIPEGIINVSPHDMNFLDSNGKEVVIASTCILNASAIEKVIKEKDGITYVTPEFVPQKHLLPVLKELKAKGFKVCGSLIAAQAYKGLVLALTPAKGYERAKWDQKKMALTKFTIYN